MSWIESAVIALAVCGAGASACQCRTQDSRDETAEAPKSSVGDCERVGGQLTIPAPNTGSLSFTPTRAGGDKQGEAPFSVEVGASIAIGNSYLTTALRAKPKGYEAVIAVMDDNGLGGSLSSLGELKGDASPPRIVRSGVGAVVAVQRVTAKGLELQLAQVSPGNVTSPDWRPGPRQRRDENNNFSLAAGAQLAVVAWDEWDSKASEGVVMIAPVALGGREENEPELPDSQRVSRAGDDAESPRLAHRSDGGYWIVWAVNAPRGVASTYDPEHGRTRGGGLEHSLAFGARWLELAELNEKGELTGKPHRVTPRDQRVVGFDLLAAADGEAWLAWRHGAPSPAAPGGEVKVLTAKSGGQVQRFPVVSGDLGAGEPQWLTAGVSHAPWLTYADSQDRTRLLRMARIPAGGEAWTLNGELSSASALAARGDQLLFAVPRGRTLELALGRCGSEVDRSEIQKPSPARSE